MFVFCSLYLILSFRKGKEIHRLGLVFGLLVKVMLIDCLLGNRHGCVMCYKCVLRIDVLFSETRFYVIENKLRRLVSLLSFCTFFLFSFFLLRVWPGFCL